MNFTESYAKGVLGTFGIGFENMYGFIFPLPKNTKTMRILSILSLILITLAACRKEPQQSDARSAVGTATTFNPNDSEAELSSVLKVDDGTTSFYIGYQQVSSNNQNPILAKFENGQQVWVKTDYELTGDDSKGYGLLWDGADRLYAVFSSTGAQGSSSEDFRRFAQNGWLSSYGASGGPKVAVLAKINPADGTVENASFLYAKLSNGNSNSMNVKALSFDENWNLVVNADSWYSPLNVDQQPFSCSGSSPFDYSITFNPDLSEALSASANGCN